MPFAFGPRSLANFKGVHPDLVRVMTRAINESTVDFSIIAGLRTAAEEEVMVASGASTTMHSRHLANLEGLGCAIDFAAYVDGAISWDVEKYYLTIIATIKKAAAEENVPVESGGDWVSFRDWGHCQLPWNSYP